MWCIGEREAPQGRVWCRSMSSTLSEHESRPVLQQQKVSTRIGHITINKEVQSQVGHSSLTCCGCSKAAVRTSILIHHGCKDHQLYESRETKPRNKSTSKPNEKHKIQKKKRKNETRLLKEIGATLELESECHFERLPVVYVFCRSDSACVPGHIHTSISLAPQVLGQVLKQSAYLVGWSAYGGYEDMDDVLTSTIAHSLKFCLSVSQNRLYYKMRLDGRKHTTRSI